MKAPRIFGFVPTDLKASTYNSLIAVVGAILYADTWAQTFGLIFMIEAVLVSIERCWPENERPR